MIKSISIETKRFATICFYNTKIYRDMLTDWVIEYLFIRPQNLHRKFNLSFVSAGKIVSLKKFYFLQSITDRLAEILSAGK